MLKNSIVRGPKRASYADLAKQLGVSESAARMATSRLRGRYRELLRDEIAQTVGLVIRPVFHIPLRGSMTLFLGVPAIYVITMTGLGIVAGTIARNMGQVGMLAMLILLPVIILSGTFTPPEGRPPWLNGVSMLVPLRHYFEITTGISSKVLVWFSSGARLCGCLG